MINIKTRRGVIEVVLIRFVAVLLGATVFTFVPAVSAENSALQLSDYRGNIVILDFWASWCGPCRRSFPWMNEMQQRYGDDGLVIIAVNLDNNPADAAKFLQEYPADFAIAYDRGGELARQYSVQTMPSSLVIDREGQVIEHHFGFKSGDTDEYEAAIVAALFLNQQIN